ncbi:MAG: flagellar basal body rod protein FlgB [Pseudomonadales bacterium]|jgi:flagellar basal-body rod protein FlgB|nr:flagellar basal body rod protein FlgB [Pseudomonadales bacterium]
MTQGLDQLFATHERALGVLDRRLSLLGSNLANVDTPGYKARDIDFREALAEASATTSMARTHAGHMALGGTDGDASVQYRIPLQASLDGNTVDAHVEKSAFADATVRYESTLTFLSRRISGLKSVLRGE